MPFRSGFMEGMEGTKLPSTTTTTTTWSHRVTAQGLEASFKITMTLNGYAQ